VRTVRTIRLYNIVDPECEVYNIFHFNATHFIQFKTIHYIIMRVKLCLYCVVSFSLLALRTHNKTVHMVFTRSEKFLSSASRGAMCPYCCRHDDCEEDRYFVRRVTLLFVVRISWKHLMANSGPWNNMGNNIILIVVTYA